MPEQFDSLCLGSPGFFDAGLQALARSEGAASAWRAAWQRAGAVSADAAVAMARAADGNFAVALHLPNGQAVMAVDCFAEQTLCYRVVDSQLRFAERADALADSGAQVDAQAVFAYLYHHCIPSPGTVFKDVFRLPPGHCAVFDKGQLTVTPFWRASFTEPAESRSFEDWKSEFRGLLSAAVSARLDGGVPACFLSGGTDSSTVAGLIGQVSGRAAHTYSIGFEAEGYDEMTYARIAATHFGCQHHEYYVTPDDLVQGIAKVAASYDQPFGNSSALPAYYCALRAREDGVTRMQAGDGGDELFGGNTRYAKQRVFDVYQSVPAGLRSALLEPVFLSALVSNTPVLKKGSSYIRQAKVAMPDRLETYNLLTMLGMDNILTPGFIAQVDLVLPAQQQSEVWSQAGTGDIVNRMLAYDWRYTLAESDLPKVRGTSRLAGMDVAYPMLDRALLDFSMRLPISYKLKGLKLRWFFKEALRDFLPAPTLTKKKQGFGLPFGVWMMRHAALHALASDSLASLSTRGIVRPEFIRELIDQRMREHAGYYGEMVWILMMLEQWLQQHAPSARFGA